MIQLRLYSTSHCHLCDEAEILLLTLTKQYDVHFTTIEISGSDELIEEYGTRIPVVRRLNDNAEFQWPFSLLELEQFILSSNR